MLKTGMLIQLNQQILLSVIVQQILFNIRMQYTTVNSGKFLKNISSFRFWDYRVGRPHLYLWKFQISLLGKLHDDVPNSNNPYKQKWKKAVSLEFSNYVKTLQNQTCNWKLCWKEWSAIVRCALMKNVSSSAKYKSNHDFLF